MSPFLESTLAGFLGNLAASAVGWMLARGRARLMALTEVRDGHGNGAGMPHAEVALKDLRPANAEQTARNVAERKRRGRPFQKGNKASSGRAPTLALLGVKADELPELARRDLKKADRYRQRRVREAAGAHGYASSGTCAVYGSAALVLASQRQVALLAFQTGDPALHKLAADLAEKHSQLELKAGFMAKDEAAARPRESAREALERRILASKGEPRG